jgi:hypothetical protein
MIKGKTKYAGRGEEAATAPSWMTVNKDCITDSRGIEDSENRW